MNLQPSRHTKDTEELRVGAATHEAVTQFDQLPNKYDQSLVQMLAQRIMSDQQFARSLGVRRFEGMLGSGADSIVLGAGLLTGCSVALKVSRPFPAKGGAHDNRDIFERELQTLQLLCRGKIPHIVGLHDSKVLSHEGGGIAVGVLVLARAVGRPALELLKSAAASDQTATFIRELYADLLEVAVAGAELGISFRDIDPSNAIVVVDSKGRLQQSTVLDFGQCRLRHASATDALEETMSYALKPRDMGYPVWKCGRRTEEYQEMVGFIEDTLSDFAEGVIDLRTALQMLRTGDYL